MAMTMNDLARISRIGRGTISRVINNEPHVSLKTREKVLKAMSKAGYQPNISAKRLRQQRSNTIGVLVPRGVDFGSKAEWYYVSEILRGIGAVAEGSFNYDLLLEVLKEEQKQFSYAPFFISGKVDGGIVIFPYTDDPGFRELEEIKAPVVLINSSSKVLDYVTIENKNSTKQMMSHLIGLGHKKIAFLGGMQSAADFRERFEAYRESLEENSLPYFEELVAHGNYMESLGYENMKKILLHKPTAVFAPGDDIALGVMRAAKEAGMRIPQDIAVAGFNDIPAAQYSNPPLTTISLPFFEVAKEAVKILVRRLEENPAQQQIKIIPGKLIIRESTGG
jgi:DNA-binding LacI/PurR family transcriptional regulator